jgi:Mce-associated membrane protein
VAVDVDPTRKLIAGIRKVRGCRKTSTAAADIVDEPADEPSERAAVEPDDAAVGRPYPAVRLAIIVGLVIVVALAGLSGWLGQRAYRSHQAAQQSNLFLQVARQGALNLTTISYTEADADIRRILESSTGTFHDDFQKRSQPFIDLVTKAQAKSEGTITEAGMESADGDQARVLLAVTVKTSDSGAQDQQPRLWRMRITVQKVDQGAKVSDVVFVP